MRGTVLLGLMGIALGAGAAETADIEQLLQSGKAQEAYALAQSRAEEGAGDPEFDMLLGLAAAAAGESNQAIFAFERVLMVQPDHQLARLELARAHFQLGNYASARSGFSAVLQADPPPNVRQAIERYLAELAEIVKRDQTTRLPAHRAYVELSAGHDSNINSATQDSVVEGFPFTLGKDSRATSSSFWQLNYGFDLEHPLSKSKYLFGGASGWYRDNTTNDTFDTRVLNLKAGLGLIEGDNSFRLPLQYQEYNVDSDTFRRLWSLNPEWTHRLSETEQGTLFAQLGTQRFPDNTLRDVNMWLLGGAWTRRFTGANTTVSLGVYYADEDARHSTGNQNGRDYYGMRLSGEWKVRPGHTPYASLTLQHVEHDAPHPVFGKTREDDLIAASLGWRWRADKHWSLGAETSYRKNDSNLNIFQYQRVQYQISTRYDFF